VIAKRFGVDPNTVQRIAHPRPFATQACPHDAAVGGESIAPGPTLTYTPHPPANGRPRLLETAMVEDAQGGGRRSGHPSLVKIGPYVFLWRLCQRFHYALR
jgi:hypothetical protein